MTIHNTMPAQLKHDGKQVAKDVRERERERGIDTEYLKKSMTKVNIKTRG